MIVIFSECGKERLQAVARLHTQAIRTGFLSRLGPRFLTQLYKSIGRSPYSRIFVAVDQESQNVAGFAACSLNTAAMYHYILLRRGVLFLFLLLPRVFCPGNLKFMCETLFYPRKAKKKALVRNANAGSGAELLSIAVSDGSRKKGVGRTLLNALESYLNQNGVTSYKTVTFSSDRDSNAFYTRCGFLFLKEVEHHRNVLNQYVKSLGPK